MIDWTPATHREAVLLALDGLNKTWNDGSDMDFVMAAVTQALKEYNIDLRRIYAIGFSSGAALAFKLGYEHGDLFAAVGVYAGLGSKGTASKRKAAFVFLHGTADSSASLSSAKATVKDLKAAGYKAELIEEKGLTHDYTQEASKKLWNRVKLHQIR